MLTKRSLPVFVHGPVSRKSRKLFGPEKPFVKLRPSYSVKPVFSYVVKGIKIKITATFRASRRLSFEDTKRIMSPEMRPKSLGTFEKQAPGSKTSIYSFFGARGIDRNGASARVFKKNFYLMTSLRTRIYMLI